MKLICETIVIQIVAERSNQTAEYVQIIKLSFLNHAAVKNYVAHLHNI